MKVFESLGGRVEETEKEEKRGEGGRGGGGK